MSAKFIKPLSQHDLMGKMLMQHLNAEKYSNPLDMPNLSRNDKHHEMNFHVELDKNVGIFRDTKHASFGSTVSHVIKGVNMTTNCLFLKLTIPTWDATSTDYIKNIYDAIASVNISINATPIHQYSGDFLNLFYYTLQNTEWRTYITSIAHINDSTANCQANSATNTTYYIPLFLIPGFNTDKLDFESTKQTLRLQECDLKIDIMFRATTNASPYFVLPGGTSTHTPIISQSEIIIRDKKSGQHIEEHFSKIPSLIKNTTMNTYTEEVSNGATSAQIKIQLSSKIQSIIIRVYGKTQYDAGATLAFNATELAKINSLKVQLNGSILYDTQQSNVLKYNLVEKFEQFGHIDFYDTNFLIIPFSSDFKHSMQNHNGHADFANSSNSLIELNFTATAAITRWDITIFEHQFITIDNNKCFILK